jgi:hypothetical protein
MQKLLNLKDFAKNMAVVKIHKKQAPKAVLKVSAKSKKI